MTARIKGIILIIATILSTVTIFISANAKPISVENTVSEKKEIQYFLGEFKGNLAIFKSNSATPIEILDVQLSSLPERDIERIKNGIVADSLAEIIKIVEDYE